jgi:hypothetical protein
MEIYASNLRFDWRTLSKRARGQELQAIMAAARNEYHRLTSAYDELWKQSHELDHGSAELVRILRKVNAVGPEALTALDTYSKAAKDFINFHSPKTR